MISKGLYIIATPIGNLEDISKRALKILNFSDIILCEDTRHSLKLLNHFKIKKPLVSYHKFNEKKNISKIIQHLNGGKILTLISDAGTPTISDPGSLLIKTCIENKIDIFPIPGPSAITTAMSVSGFDNKFLFFGFLPKTENELQKKLSELAIFEYSIIFFVPSLKINFYLKNFKKFFSGRKILIAREISKIHETFYREEIESIKLFKSPIKGELTIVISEKINKRKEVDLVKISKEIKKYLKKYSLKDVVELMAKKEQISKKKLYSLCLSLKNEKNS